ncbi:FeoB-associated Cys-rich membrane protein [Oscillibacter sp. MSJ-2]|uniref:FeoB-associated Cys-rich membrane protein n=1 Tax=Dysosmobacter acutus TaxID=2841504 RepID=A0ABS6FBB5_9FIRM|nr:FeoB-associated Cys-rich membrane protein [Dysosmobacter acutus]MBU5627570.1 FeoB-associated Cys-rich membrane protein [Dysosmobacter acutus]
MNLPTILISLLILAVFIAIVARGICNKKHGKGGCSCGGDCGDCGGGCHCK